jgi:hypothetical protein
LWFVIASAFRFLVLSLVGITIRCTGRTGNPPQFCFKMGQYAGDLKAVVLLRVSVGLVLEVSSIVCLVEYVRANFSAGKNK